MKLKLYDLIFTAGIALVVSAAWRVDLSLGLATLGVFLCVFAYLVRD